MDKSQKSTSGLDLVTRHDTERPLPDHVEFTLKVSEKYQCIIHS